MLAEAGPPAATPEPDAYLLFRLSGAQCATAVHEVREVTRLAGLVAVPGGGDPDLVGLLSMRGLPVPVFDRRAGTAGRSSGDVLVTAGEPVGVVVDQVLGVRPATEFGPAGGPVSGLAGYVRTVRRLAGDAVLIVHLHALAAARTAEREPASGPA